MSNNSPPQVSAKRRALLDALAIKSLPLNPHGLTLDEALAEAQKAANESGVDVALGWQQNDVTLDREYGWCTVEALELLVLEPVYTIKPYKGGRANYAERQDARRERLETAATRAAGESSARFDRARSSIAGIPFGQPILVGHHSEKRHRGALAKHDTNMRAAIDADTRAKELSTRASSVGEGGISSDDPAAVVKLRAELAECETSQKHMNDVNAIVRKYRVTQPQHAIELMTRLGMTSGAAADALKPDFCGRYGYPDYRTKNNGANMRRIRKRIEQLQATAAVPEGVRATSKGGVIFQVEDNRVQLLFAGKPSAEIRDRLKRGGFRWAPSAGAWQRNLNNAGEYAAREMIRFLDEQTTQEGT